MRHLAEEVAVILEALMMVMVTVTFLEKTSVVVVDLVAAVERQMWW